jgi:hypothetical protein
MVWPVRLSPVASAVSAAVAARASFILPLRDLGDGEVDTALTRGIGSATFTRATTATTRGPMYLSLPGASGDYASTPDSASNSFAEGIEIVAKLLLDDWTPLDDSTIASKWTGTGNQRAWMFRVSASGGLTVSWSLAGSSISATLSSSVSAGFTDGTTHWVKLKVSSDGSTGSLIDFFTSEDGETWTRLGTQRTSVVAPTFFDSSAPVEIGTNSGGVGDILAGKIFRVKIYDGSGTLIHDFNPADTTDGDTSFASSTTGETWTINGSAAIRGGLLASVASGTPRSYYLSDGTYAGYLAEGARTNICLQ